MGCNLVRGRLMGYKSLCDGESFSGEDAHFHYGESRFGRGAELLKSRGDRLGRRAPGPLTRDGVHNFGQKIESLEGFTPDCSITEPTQ